MAKQMTRAEYQRQFGTAPGVSSIDNTPAPVRMTREEYNRIYNTGNSEPKQSFLQRVTPAPIRNMFNSLSDIKDDFTETAGALGGYTGTKEQQQSRLTQRAIENPGETLVDDALIKTGTALSSAFGIAGIAGIGLAKSLLSQENEDRITGFFSEFGDALGERAQSQLQTMRESDDPADQEFAATIDDIIQFYQTDERFKDEVDAVGGFAEIFSAGLVGRITPPRSGGIPGRTPKPTTPNIKPAPSRRAKDILSIETNYANTRRANEFEFDGGDASRERIAATNVLEGVVDEDGIIRTRDRGGAVDQYRAQTVDKYESVVRDSLEREGKVVTLSEIRNHLTRVVNDTKGLEGADLVAAIKGIERELQGLSLRVDSGLEELPLAKVQDAKISTTRNINFNTPPETATYRKAIARGYKELIERKSDLRVGEINNELAKFYTDIERLERLDGKRVKGGRLGKYFAQTSGNIIGGAAGTVAGGPGAALGAMAGGEIAARLQGRAMAGTFGKGGTKTVSNTLLDAAKRDSKLPVERPLDVPDRPVGAPRGVQKTKEITAIEGKIKKNIREQKTAIKAKDWDLVAALKTVYDALLEQLREAVENVSAGLSIRASVTPLSVAKKVDLEDVDEIRVFLDNPQNALLDDKLNRLIEEIGISKADTDTQVRFLKEVLDEVEQLVEAGKHKLIT